jgi:predicted amidophosphoribosyltransferase
MEEPVVCPSCGAELEEIPGRCHLCGYKVELSRWEVVAEVSTEWEAELLCGRLRSHGIPAHTHSQRDSTRMFTLGELAVVKVFVPAPYRERARRLLECGEP